MGPAGWRRHARRGVTVSFGVALAAVALVLGAAPTAIADTSPANTTSATTPGSSGGSGTPTPTSPTTTPTTAPPTTTTTAPPSTTTTTTAPNTSSLAAGSLSAQGGVSAQASSAASDSRATFSSGNATTCAGVGLSGTQADTADNPSNGSTNVGPGLFTLTVASYTNADIQSPFQIQNGGTPAGDAQMVQISNVAAGVTINGVVVKGGNGFNLYTSVSGVNMIAPLNGGGNVPALSHAFVCYTGTAATGSLTVTKTVSGTPPAGSTFTVSVACPASGTPLSGFPKTLTFDSTGSLTSGTLPITGIPAGTQCSVTETGTGGATSTTYTVNGGSPSTSPPTVTISSTTQQAVAITNTYTGSLTVSKSVVGTPPEGSSFTVSVACPASGTPLSGFPKTLTFDSTGALTSGTLPVTGIPVGTQCSVTETDAGGASSTLYSVNGGSTSSSPPTVTINATTQQSVAVSNIFPGASTVGSVQVSKVVTGAGKPPNEVKSFTVNVSCTDGTNVNLTFGTAGGSQTVNGIAIPVSGSTTCTVTETDTGQASNVSYSPEGNGQFQLTVDAPTHPLTVTNRFDPIPVKVSGVTANQAGVLAFTGMNLATLLQVAAGLLGLGLLMSWAARRRRRLA